MRHVSSWWQAALLPDRWDVCGVPCGPLSVWHVYALTELGNPYLVGGQRDKDAAAGLLMMATGDHAHGKRLHVDPWYRARVRRRIARALRRLPWADVDAAVLDYVSACRRVPAHKEPVAQGGKGSAGRRVCAPMGWILVSWLNAGDMETAWNTPYAVARCLFDARRDVSGEDDTLESLEEEARFDAIVAERIEANGGR